MRLSFICVFGVLAAGLCAVKAGTEERVLKEAGTIALEGVKGRIDHMAVDEGGKRLYVAALGNDTVEVVELEAGKRVGRIEGLKMPQGVCVMPGTGELVVASRDDGMCRKYDAGQKLVGKIEGLDDADNVRCDSEGKRVYVGYGDGALAVIDAEKFVKVGEIKLEGHPESFQLEAKGPRIFVNVPGAGYVEVVDREKGVVREKWAIKEARANYPMALDEGHHRLFVGCRNPAKLVVLDTETGKAVARMECCGDTDDVYVDGAGKRVYVSGGEGCISVFERGDGDHYGLAEKMVTAVGARTSILVTALGRLYVAVPKRGEQKAELRMFDTGLDPKR